MRIILGSESKWRKELLTKMGYQFEVMASNIDEKTIRDERPEVLTLKLAEAKNKALRTKLKGDYLLITADQVVVVNGKIREKPATWAEAHLWLETAHVHPATTYTGIGVYNSAREYFLADVDVAMIHFNQFSKKTLKALAGDEDLMRCAGGFTVEHPSIDPYIQKITGTKDSIQGFPKKLAARLIGKVWQPKPPA